MLKMTDCEDANESFELLKEVSGMIGKYVKVNAVEDAKE